MIKQIVLLLIVFAAVALATECTGADVSGPNVASPAKRQAQASPSCQANVSGPNVASPAKRTTQVCSGNGYCSGENCVCLAGFTGADCETPVASTTCQADVSGPNVASPAKRTTQCNGNGSCQNGQCVCGNGFYGADCEVPVSSSCSQADVSGPNVASPAKRTEGACSGNGYCVGNKLCVCNAGFSGSNCEVVATTCPPTAAPTTAAPTTAAPTTEAPTTAAPTTAAPTTAAPTTAAPTTAEPSAANPSPSCQANVSGPNVASPARFLRFLRQAQVCSGQGNCNENNVCVCNAGFSGRDCEVAPTTAAPEPSPSCQANVSGPNVASPARFLRQAQVCSGQGNCDGNNVCVCNAGYSGRDCEVAPSTAAPTTAAPTTAAPTTAAPTTAAPTTTTAAPTNSEPSPTCQANVSGPNVASPARFLRQAQVCNGQGVCDGNNVCVCNAGYSGRDCQVAPTTATPTSTENISGDNNARADNSAGKIISLGGIIVAIAVAVL